MSAMYPRRDPFTPALAQELRDLERLVEPAFAQSCWCDRDGDESVHARLARDGASEETGEHGHDAQVPAELQPSDEVVHR